MTLTGKIELLIKRSQMSASQFADLINIPRSSISHIISGRNKPSLDVVQKILKQFPDISAEELLYEDRQLTYTPELSKPSKSPGNISTSPAVTAIGGLFDALVDGPRESSEKKHSKDDSVESNVKPIEKVVQTHPENLIEKPSVVNQIYQHHIEKQIERVIIFYSDGTFSESKPSK